MTHYLCIDSGTTNTRIHLVSDGTVKDTLKYHVGAQKGIDHKNLLKETLKNGIQTILTKNGLHSCDIAKILASGMITSEFGLLELPHLSLPAGLKELHDAMAEASFPEISDIPFVFLRGVRTTGEDLAHADMMRGEETELMGIAANGPAVYLLPGSHSKIIETDSDGKIVDLRTMLTGEMITALSQNTLLKDAVELDAALNETDLLSGYRYCKEHGINEALFKVRVLKNLFGKSAENIYSFYLGTVLCDEIRCILAKGPEKIIVGGNAPIKKASVALLQQLSPATVLAISDADAQNATALGMVKIYE